jgi:hypothetical protein
MSGLTQEELLKENPALANGVEVGMEIKIQNQLLSHQ